MRVFSLVLRTSLAQITLQAIGFLGGILVIRLLPVPEYAIYTILAAALGTLTSLSDAGIANAVMAQAGQTNDRGRMSRIVATGLAYRYRLSILVGVVAAPTLVWLLVKNGQPLMGAFIGVAAVGLAFLPTAATGLLEVPLKLKQVLLPLQWVQLQTNAMRLGLVVASLWALPVAAVALAGGALTQWWMNTRLRLLLNPHIDLTSPMDPEAAQEVRRVIWRTMPGTLYHCFAGQLGVWLLVLFGNAVSVAQIGALGRLAMVFSVVQAVISLIVLPRFARLPPRLPVLLGFYAKLAALLASLGALLSVMAWFLPEPLLWLLGPDYASLRTEVALMVMAGALSFIGSAFYALNNVRSYLQPAYLPPLLGLSHTLVLLLLLDVSSVHGVLQMQAILAAFSILYSGLTFVFYARIQHEPLHPDT